MSTSVSFAKGIFAGLGAAAALLTFTPPVQAGPSEALAACKTDSIKKSLEANGFTVTYATN